MTVGCHSGHLLCFHAILLYYHLWLVVLLVMSFDSFFFNGKEVGLLSLSYRTGVYGCVLFFSLGVSLYSWVVSRRMFCRLMKWGQVHLLRSGTQDTLPPGRHWEVLYVSAGFHWSPFVCLCHFTISLSSPPFLCPL